MGAAPRPVTALPAGTRLVHIGPPKTGTTSLQGACWVARHELRRQGVRYAGPVRHSARAARAVVGAHLDRDAGEGEAGWAWRGIVREIRRARDPFVFYSSEHLAHATETEARTIVRDLDPARVRLLVTVRPIARMLTSLWQQSVAAGSGRGFESWLIARLGTSGPIPDHPMWFHQRHDTLVGRWAGVVGPDRVTVLVLDPGDPSWLIRRLEDLLAVREGTLELHSHFVSRSLTLPEVEAIRALNQQLRTAGLTRAAITKVASRWISPYLETRAPPPDEARIRLPAWAQARAEPLARAIVDGIRASGVTVIGQLDSLLAPAPTTPDGDATPAPIPAELAATLAMGVAYTAGMLHATQQGGDQHHLAGSLELPYLSSRDLVSVPLARIRRVGPLFLRYWLGLGAP